MAGSTINGSAGASANGAIVTAVPVDSRGALLVTNGVPVLPTQNIVGSGGGNSSGLYSLTNLAKGNYVIKIAPPQPNPSGAVAPWPQTQVLTTPYISVDGSSTYAV